MYATATQLHGQNSGRPMFTASSNPSLIDAERFLAESSAVIDSLLAERGYVTPVPTAASASRLTLQHFALAGAARAVEYAAPTSDRRKEVDAAWAWAQKMLKEGAIHLPDAPMNTRHEMPRANLPDRPLISRDMEF